MSDDVSGYPGAPPGWYPDPAGGPGQRWWDGYSWTEAAVLPSVPPPPPSSFPSPPPPWATSQPGYGGGAYPTTVHQRTQNAQGSVGDELRISSVGRFAIAFPGVITLVNLIVWVANASQWRDFGHQLHVSMQAAQNNQPAPIVTAPNSFGALTSLLGLCAIAALVVQCIWQFRAATAARSLQFPAKHSPGWGVGFRFIPIVNLWMPYQAIRDCLAPTDPNRAAVLRYWLFTVGIEIGIIVTLIAMLISTPVGAVFAILTGICALGVLATAPKVVTCIAAAHRAAVNP